MSIYNAIGKGLKFGGMGLFVADAFALAATGAVIGGGPAALIGFGAVAAVVGHKMDKAADEENSSPKPEPKLG